MKKKVLDEFPNYTIYSNGKVYSIKSKKYLQPCTNRSGYKVIELYNNIENRTFSLGHLIAECFLTAEKTKYIRYKDGNKSNNKAKNLAYCNFSDLLSKANPRKKREAKLTIEELFESYKYYFQDVSERQLKKLIAGNQYYCERIIYSNRSEKISAQKKEIRIFASHINGNDYKSLAHEFGFSIRKVSAAILTCRRRLLKDIQLDIFEGKLIYSPLGDVKSQNTAYKMLSAQELFYKTSKRHLSSVSIDTKKPA